MRNNRGGRGKYRRRALSRDDLVHDGKLHTRAILILYPEISFFQIEIAEYNEKSRRLSLSVSALVALLITF